MAQSSVMYLSYMLRMWRTDRHWRASLTDPLTGEQIGFCSLEMMVTFLQRQIDHTRDARAISHGRTCASVDAEAK
jgi:hypothetical protein